MQAFFLRIIDFIFPPRDTEALVREADIEEIGRLAAPVIMPCGTVALLPYRARLIQALIIEAKFKDSRLAQQRLARILADYLAEWSAESASYESKPVLLVPVPLSRQRMRERGYNQVEKILHETLLVTPEIGSLANHALIRSRHTTPQTSLGGRQRRKNMTDAFTALGPIDSSSIYVIIDDVITTGTTLEEAASCLRAAGAEDVRTLALAH